MRLALSGSKEKGRKRRKIDGMGGSRGRENRKKGVRRLLKTIGSGGYAEDAYDMHLM